MLGVFAEFETTLRFARKLKAAGLPDDQAEVMVSARRLSPLRRPRCACSSAKRGG